MKPLYTKKEFIEAKATALLSLQCYQCSIIFKQRKNLIQQTLKGKNKSNKYCSHACADKARSNKNLLACTNCQTLFHKPPSQIKKSKNHFCSRSCSATYNNKHKSHGTKRSKLESYIENQLTILYPNLHIDFNKKDAIGSELDIYIPSINLAFELNGIFHYEPIFGTNKLDQIQSNDENKFQSCINHGISLCIIDASSLKYFKPSNCQKYLDIITNIISKELSLIS